MASWLKAAEDLFEVVDRRAKLVVSELADEQVNLQSSGPNIQGSQTKNTQPRKKAQKRISTNGSPKIGDAVEEKLSKKVIQDPEPNAVAEKDRDALPPEVEGDPLLTQINSEQDHNNESGASRIPLSESPSKMVVKHEANQDENSGVITDASGPISTSNSEPLNGNGTEVQLEHPPSPLPFKEIEVSDADHLNESGRDTKFGNADSPSKIDQEGSGPVGTDSPVKNEAQLINADGRVETPIHQKMPPEDKADTPVALSKKADIPKARVQDQLDEAQGLLKTTNPSGQSKEARLARVCAGLSTRLQEYKSENAQLEELLIAERELSKSYEARIKQLQQEFSSSKNEVTRVESNMLEALAAKNSEIEALVSSLDVLKKQAAASEGNLASVQANMESIMRNRELTETRMMQALREELASAERRAEEERSAHNATKMAAMEREVELEHRAVESSTALARIQRVADERTAKAAELERKLALLEVECASLNQELQDMEARARHGQKKSPDDANQMIQMQAWQEEVERARQGQRDAESKLSSMEAELQKMRVEMASMKRDAEHYSRQEHMELEKRYRELTDLLYYKQTQLENMASEKAAAEFQLEKEIKRLQEAQTEVERSKVSRRASTSWDEEAEIKSLEPLPLHHRHMAAASIQLQKAAKLLDTGAVRATRFLWRYPTARIIFIIYLVFVHLFLMYLLHRLQEQADDLAAREVAKTMGLSTP